MTDDLSTRLLEALTEVSVRHQRRQGSPDPSGRSPHHWDPLAAEARTVVIGVDSDDDPYALIFRLCQAHREIVEMHRADPEQPYSWGGQTCSECSSEECGHYVRYPCPTLRTLATAYGIQEET